MLCTQWVWLSSNKTILKLGLDQFADPHFKMLATSMLAFLCDFSINCPNLIHTLIPTG